MLLSDESNNAMELAASMRVFQRLHSNLSYTVPPNGALQSTGVLVGRSNR